MSETTRRSESVLPFGSFTIDRRSLELRREGKRLRLQQQPTRVLALLVERAGDLVTREELRQAIWGDDVVVDFDRGLNFCISQIRGVLAENPEDSCQIETLRGRGYRLVGFPRPGPMPGLQLPLDPPARTRRWWPPFLAGVATLVVFGGFGPAPRHPSLPPPFGMFSPARNASEPGESSSPADQVTDDPSAHHRRPVVEGRVDRHDSQYRVTVTLREVNGSVRWSDCFEGRPGDWVEAQNEMSRIIPQVARHDNQGPSAGEAEPHVARRAQRLGPPPPLVDAPGSSASIFGFPGAYEFRGDAQPSIAF